MTFYELIRSCLRLDAIRSEKKSEKQKNIHFILKEIRKWKKNN